MLTRISVATVFAICLLLLLVACGRSPSVTFYTLESSQSGTEQSVTGTDGISLGLRQVILPAVLKRPQLVLIENEIVKPLEYHRWSEPLDVAMSQILSNELRDRLNSSTIFSYPWPAAFNPAQTLTIKVARFNGLPDKSVELTGVWLLRQGDAAETVQTERFNIVTKVEGNNYSALVRAHSAALKQLSVQLAEALTVPKPE